MNNVRDFGAVGDGVTLDTHAIQSALDAGGVVYFPAGTYLSGTLYLRSQGGLELAPGAVLLASPNREDYNADDFSQDNHIYPTEAVSGAHFIIAERVTDVILRGGGRIDGNRPAIYDLPDNIVCGYETITWRPAQMIFFLHCERVRVENLQLTNSTYWSCFFYDCQEVQVRGLNIKNPMATPNGDGLDIDACRKVTVSDCIIETGDDCIAIRAVDHFGAKYPVCENVVISNCVLTTVCNAVRIGVGNGIIRNVLMNNCSIVGSRTGFCIASQYWEGESMTIENCLFSNLSIEAKRPFSLHSNAWGRKTGPSTGRISDLTFTNIRCSTSAGNLIDAYSPGDIRNITFNLVDCFCDSVAPEATFEDENYDFTEATLQSPRSLWLVRNAENIRFIQSTSRMLKNIPEITQSIISVKSSVVY